MSGLPEAFRTAWAEQAHGASKEALAIFLILALRSSASPASLSRQLGLPQANVLRALAELSAPDRALVVFSAESGMAGRRTVSLTERGQSLQSLLKSP